jgi:hypothetical protein
MPGPNAISLREIARCSSGVNGRVFAANRDRFSSRRRAALWCCMSGRIAMRDRSACFGVVTAAGGAFTGSEASRLASERRFTNSPSVSCGVPIAVVPAGTDAAAGGGTASGDVRTTAAPFATSLRAFGGSVARFRRVSTDF